MGNVFGRLSAKLRRFVAANGGNVAMTFGLATLPIIGGVGAAIDFGHAHAVKSAMQSALDATHLSFVEGGDIFNYKRSACP